MEAVLVAPLIEQGRVILPPGTRVSGELTSVKRVGLGLLHERASVKVEFKSLQIEGHAAIPIETRLFSIENAREKLDKAGKVRGIRSTNTPGFRASGVLTGLAAVDPIALLFSTAAFGSTLRFSDPEIKWAPGAELILELKEPVESAYSEPIGMPAVSRTEPERIELQTLVERLPYRTTRLSDEKKSDLTNLMFIGQTEAVQRAFAAAGWVQAMDSTASSKYRSLRAFAESQPYQEAPMSALLLDGAEAVLTMSKTLNTFTRRHHLRVYLWKETWDGLPIFQSAATHDTDIVMSLKNRTITHEIDARIDEERAKIVNDLIFTGCVDSAEWVGRPWVEESLFNGSGQQLKTDRALAVLKLNDCANPRVVNSEKLVPTRPLSGNLLERGTRQTILRFRNDVLRGNLVWQSTAWAFHLSRMMRKHKQPLPRMYERQTLLAALDREKQPWASDGNPAWEAGNSMIAPAPERARPDRGKLSVGGKGDWETPTVELGFTFGTSLFSQSTVGEEAWILQRHPSSTGPTMRTALSAGNQMEPGWALGGTVTIHGNRWISNELGFHYLRGSYQLGLRRGDPAGNQTEIPGLVEQRAGLLTRQFSYSTVVHMRPLESRWRPYLAAGPALQLVHLTHAPFRESRGLYRIGLSNVGMIQSAYNFASAPPLDGGGIFQPAVQFGGGLKYRYRKCWVLRLDYRNTMSHRPDLLRKSLATITDNITPDVRGETHGWFAQQRVSFGFSFTF